MRVVYYKSLLNNSAEKKAYDRIQEGFMHYETEIMINGLDYVTVSKITELILLDWPELFFVSASDIMYYYADEYVRIEIKYVMPKNEAYIKLKRLDSIANKIVSHVQNMSAYDKALWLHDYLANSVIYEIYETRSAELHTLVGALINGKCVCDGYSRAYQYLCDKAGIPCFMVVGYGTDPNGNQERHAWNMLKLEDGNYFVDVTYDKKSSKQECSRAFFLLSTQQINDDHIFDERYRLPLCPKSRCPLPVITSLDDLKRRLMQDSKMNKVISEFRFVPAVKADEYIDSFIRSIQYHEIDMYEKIKHFYYPSDSEYVSTIVFSWV